jgi:hypothetical protein
MGDACTGRTLAWTALALGVLAFPARGQGPADDGSPAPHAPPASARELLSQAPPPPRQPPGQTPPAPAAGARPAAEPGRPASQPGPGAAAAPQGPSPGPPPVTLFLSYVGYIDSAVPTSQFRLRFDAAYDFLRPNRAEFFWAQGGPGHPGEPLPETRVDYQELTSYVELALRPRFSLFLEAPVRFVNPEVNADTSGFGDLNAGFKWAFLETEDRVASLQLRTYAPTGDAGRGLGNGHVSLEPALLVFQRLGDRLRLEGELRTWVPVGGTDFAGDLVRYGVGLSYGERPPEAFWVSPVVEFVGWTVLSGKESSPGVLKDAAGDTIVNVKVGARLGFGDRADVYAGYGRALTGDAWYRDTFRVEFRLLF